MYMNISCLKGLFDDYRWNIRLTKIIAFEKQWFTEQNRN